MGGFGALRLGARYPELFGVVSSLGGALHNADTLAGGGDPEDWSIAPARRKEVFEYVYGGKKEFFQAHSPWRLVEQHADAIRGRTRIRLIVGDQDPVRGPNRRFHELLERLNIPHAFAVVAGAGHNPGQLYEGLGEDSLAFFVDAFSRVK